MAVQALLLARDHGSRDWLQRCLGDDVVILPGDASTAADSVAEVANTPDITLLFVQFDDNDAAEQIAMVESLTQAYPHLPVIAIGREGSNQVLAAMRAGAEDFFVPGEDDNRLVSLLDRVLERAQKPSPAPAADGQLISVISSAQTPLIAFLAGHIAFLLEEARARQQRVLLLDLTLPGGNAAILFDGDQDYTALDMLRNVERCDETLVDSAFQQLGGGIYMLALPEVFVGATLADEAGHLGRLLEVLRGLFAYVVVCADGGLGMDGISELVTRGEHALLLSDQSVLRSRQNKMLVQDLQQRNLDLSALKLVISNFRADVGIDPERLADLLDVPLAAKLGGRVVSRLAAMNAGESLFKHAPGDNFGRGVRALVEDLLGVTAPAARRSGGLRGWLGRAKD